MGIHLTDDKIQAVVHDSGALSVIADSNADLGLELNTFEEVGLELEELGDWYGSEEHAEDILSSIKNRAEAVTANTVAYLVIAIPDTLSRLNLQALTNAAYQAGFEFVQTVSDLEVTLAPLRTGSRKGSLFKVLILDTENKYLEVSVVSVQADSVTSAFEDVHDGLGDDSWQECLEVWVFEEVSRFTHFDSGDEKLKHSLSEEVIRARESLTSDTLVQLNIQIGGSSRSQSHQISLSRNHSERIAVSLVKELKDWIGKALAEEEMNPDEIDGVVGLGKTYLVPGISSILAGFGRSDRILLEDSVSLAARGAASMASEWADASLNSDPVYKLDHDLRVPAGKSKTKALISRDTALPQRKEIVFTRSVQGEIVTSLWLGNSNIQSENTLLDRIEITDLETLPLEVTRILLSVEVSADGQLQIDAKPLLPGESLPVQSQNKDEPVTSVPVNATRDLTSDLLRPALPSGLS